MIATNFNSFVPKIKSTTTTIKDVYYAIKNNGGYSFNPYYNLPDKGFIVSLKGGKKIENFNSFSAEKKLDIIYQWTKRPITNTDFYGFWLDNDTLYCDVSKVYNDKDKAMKTGLLFKQLSIYDIQNKCVIWL